MLKSLFKGKVTNFTGEYRLWEDAKSHSVGYDDKTILDRVITSTLKVKSGEIAYERDGILFEDIEYSWQILTGLMLVAARNNGNLCVLDIGGSLGTTYFQNKKYIDSVNLSSWNVVEQSHYVNAGKQYIQDDIIKFYESIEQCQNECNPNLIIISSALQYFPDINSIINSMISVGADAILFDKTFINYSNSNKIYVQHANPSIGGSYPCYSISESWLINKLNKRYELSSFP